jgi:hypothetical protein
VNDLDPIAIVYRCAFPIFSPNDRFVQLHRDTLERKLKMPQQLVQIDRRTNVSGFPIDNDPHTVEF